MVVISCLQLSPCQLFSCSINIYCVDWNCAVSCNCRHCAVVTSKLLLGRFHPFIGHKGR
jgi:hypothetical protein